MGRTVVVEECLRGDLDGLVALNQFQIGILVGQLTQTKDYVTLVIRTPTLQEINKEDAASESSTPSLFQEWWVIEHAKQMSALLPGGLSVIGLFVCCSNELFKSVQFRVLKALKDIQQFSHSRCTEASSHHSILLHCSTNSKRNSCQTTDLGNPQGGYRPAELKYQAHRDQWLRLESCLSLNTQCCVYFKEGVPVHELVKSGLESVIDEIWGSVVTVRGRVVKDESELLVKLKKGQQQQSSIKMGWLLKKPVSPFTPPTSLSKARRIRLHGNMSLLAYVHTKATCADAISAMKQDAERSLLARVTAMCESMSDSDTDLNLSSCQLPCRLAIVLPINLLHLTEYVFQEEEDVQDALTRVCELTGMSATSLATRQMEQAAVVSTATVEDREEEEEVQSDNVVKSYSAVLSVVATVTVALLAVSIWLVLGTS